MRDDKEKIEMKGYDFIELPHGENRKKMRRAIKRGAKNYLDYTDQVAEFLESHGRDENSGDNHDRI